ncbi:hypothetical protein EC968_007778 [Mortierella alpina]|nr:hypothetical protein EC968_007778 [Mortierella alpina]
MQFTKLPDFVLYAFQYSGSSKGPSGLSAPILRIDDATYDLAAILYGAGSCISYDHHPRPQSFLRREDAIQVRSLAQSSKIDYYRDYGKAMERCLAASESGVPGAMLKISQMYQYGRVVEQNDREAAAWYCKAEEAVIEQDRESNRIIHHDSGVSEHHTRSMQWFRNALDAGTAATNLHIGFEQDDSKAMEWYLKASDAGNAEAMFNISVMYLNGRGVKLDDSQAMEWCLKASAAEDADAMSHIGLKYRNGQGVEQDYGKVMEWLLKASDAGNAFAMFNICILYHSGQGVEQDKDKSMA